MSIIQENDAAGGAGSLTDSLLGVAINGLSRTIDGALSKKYPLTSFNENLVYNTDGDLVPVGAPQIQTPASTVLKGALSNPIIVAVGVSILIGGIVFLAASMRR